MIEKEEVLVSICMITYNHENFIREAIEGVLMQNTNFPFELIIGEDCSKDSTREICIEYQNKYPEIIKLLLPEANLGVINNFLQTVKACSGKYIALCEGDDYWTDPFKLQKQVDFLEKNKSQNVIAVVTNCSTSDLNGKLIQENRIVIPPENKSDVYNLHDFFRNNHFYPTLTILFNNIYLKWISSEMSRMSNPFLGDWILFVLLHSKGNVGFINEVTASYRINPNSVTHTVNVVNRWKADFTIRKQLIQILPTEYHRYLKSNYYGYFMIGMAYRKQKKYHLFLFYQLLSLFSNPINYFQQIFSVISDSTKKIKMVGKSKFN